MIIHFDYQGDFYTFGSRERALEYLAEQNISKDAVRVTKGVLDEPKPQKPKEAKKKDG